ncbi:hypothetical protein [Sodalis sp. C49]|uniref:hypothetical protein n=1 Tax=unclassified Sodalis (in: enterobacteria) TaxID=2636512 RepID=UPI003965C116
MKLIIVYICLIFEQNAFFLALYVKAYLTLYTIFDFSGPLLPHLGQQRRYHEMEPIYNVEVLPAIAWPGGAFAAIYDRSKIIVYTN